METVPRIAQLRTWLILSLLLHLLFTLFLATRKMVEGIQLPSIIFLPPEQKQQPMMQQATASQQLAPQPQQQLAQQPTPQPPPTPDEETVQFYLDLHKRSQFGYGAEVKLMDGEPGGDESTEPAESEAPVTKDPTQYPKDLQEKSSVQKNTDTQKEKAVAPDISNTTDTNSTPDSQENSPTQDKQSQEKPYELTQQEAQALQELNALSQEEAVFLEAARNLMKKKEEKKAPDQKQESSTTVQYSRLNQGTSRGGSPGSKSKLGRLFEGYIDYMNDPRREEMINYHQPDKRYAPYMRKVGWALQNSFYLHNRPVTMDNNLHMQVTFVLEIARDGSLQKLTITPETALPLQQHITKIIGKAAPFAPLPADFKRTHMKIEMPVVIDAQRGTHTYYLQF
jgi:hypothetical protein